MLCKHPGTLCLVFVLVSPMSFAQYPVTNGEGWTVELGLGAEREPAFSGAAATTVEAEPLLNVAYKKGPNIWFTTGTDFGYYRKVGERLRLGLSLGLEIGRDEDDDEALTGLGNIDDTEELRLDFLYGLTEDLTIGARIMTAGASKDEVVFVGMRYDFDTIGDNLELSLTGDLSYATATHLTTEFGVTEAQARASGYPVYRPGSGLKSIGFQLAGRYWLGRNWFGFGELSYERFGRAGKDSPFVQKEYEAEIGVGVGYRF